MFRVKIIFNKVGKHDYFFQYWFISDMKQVAVKSEGVTIYDENGAFKAFYYADKIVGVEILKAEDE